MRKIGVISDTHGLIRPQALQALHGVEHIIHAGDMGSPDVIDRLSSIAPVTAVRGNVDGEDWAGQYPSTAVAEFDGLTFYILHNLGDLDLNPNTAGFSAVIYGHSHIPAQEMRHGILYFNPGNAGPPRFHLPPSIGLLLLSGHQVSSEIITLDIDAGKPL
jgi:uncharacterized protein